MLLGTHSELQIQLCLHLLLLIPWNKGWYIPGMFFCMKVQSQNLSYPSSQASTDTLEQGIVYTRTFYCMKVESQNLSYPSSQASTLFSLL
ncbi:hypothetical protein POPTR_001G178600v4 [Populus trichocarpa]|jgi:hypothetical protein|uniref:Uncharacterized protein n=1 Tax=Populus trichocarpa TaxID=3694 RepID=A0A2K2BZG8_POPTR|nr:hypothetical protein BDE02_01G161700 [Populus trichocarpa]PNT55178.1 hypothetical protein POPTR_001G178600v4 [Populus trichocarpa]